ncbi:hypothetical protein MBLNU457_4327t1 [Dothideomycetes sp. NU457]
MVHTYVLAASSVLALTAYVAYKLYLDPLRRYPGPYLASITDLWRMLDAAFGAHKPPSDIALHQKYGDVVRKGPNVLSFAQAEAVADIYGTDKGYSKSEFYWTAAPTAGGFARPSLFSSLDGKWHDNLRRAIQPAFNLSALLQYEPFVDRSVESFVQEIRTRYAIEENGQRNVMQLHKWMHWYAFDVVGELTYGAPFGFLRTASDVDRIIEKAHFYLLYNQIVGNMPVLDKLLLKNPILLWLNRRGYFNSTPNPVVAFASSRQHARKEHQRRDSHVDSTGDESKDLLSKFLQAQASHPETVTDKEVLGLGISMVLAGSETTAITLAVCFYHILQNPRVYAALQKELDTELRNNDDSSTKDRQPVSFRAAQKLLYLDACIKETFRMHPAARFSPERVLPPHQTATIAGHLVSGGTVVGVNAWALHRREEIFGDDVETFRPERWIAASADDKARVDRMSRSLFQFGAGRFGCIGKHISLLEMYKVVPSLLREFEFGLADPSRELRFESGSFANVSGVDVWVRER